MDLARLLQGPAIIRHRGAVFHSTGGKQLAPTAEVFGIESDAYGTLDQRALNNAVALTLTPLGVWTQAHRDVLWRWQNPVLGQLLTPRFDVGTVDAGEDTVSLLGALVHEFDYLNFPRLGARCMFCVGPEAGTTAPAGLVDGTLYYLGMPDPEEPRVRTLHTTEAAAVAGTGVVSIGDAGAGDFFMIEQEELVIHTYQNRKITFANAAVLQMPPIVHSAVASLIGQVGFAAFRKNRAAWGDADSLYTIAKELLTDTPPAAADIPTLQYAHTWEDVGAPWEGFATRAAMTVTPQLVTAPVGNDPLGDLGLEITGVNVTAAGAPDNLSEKALLDVLGMQGGTARRGASRVRGDLTSSGTGVHTTVYNAAATALPQTFAAGSPRAGEVAWVSARTPGAPAFRVAAAAPEEES